jgi:UPF0716 protein FxsA
VAKRIAIALLLLPAAEVLAFLVVVWAIGFLPALGLMLLTSLAGSLVLRRVGRGRFGRLGTALRRRQIAEMAASGGDLLLVLGGILLLLPGFITDVIGAGLLIGPLRRLFGAKLAQALRRPKRRPKPPPGGPGAVIDLEPDEWRAIPDRKRPKSGLH